MKWNWWAKKRGKCKKKTKNIFQKIIIKKTIIKKIVEGFFHLFCSYFQKTLLFLFLHFPRLFFPFILIVNFIYSLKINAFWKYFFCIFISLFFPTTPLYFLCLPILFYFFHFQVIRFPMFHYCFYCFYTWMIEWCILNYHRFFHWFNFLNGNLKFSSMTAIMIIRSAIDLIEITFVINVFVNECISWLFNNYR